MRHKQAPENAAHRLLNQFDINEPPVPVNRLAKHLGLKLEMTELGDDISGILVVEANQGIIGINSSHSRFRQRFSIAHELGHFMLHSSDRTLFIDKRYSAYRDSRSATGEIKQEREANAFAAALLMPKGLLTKVVDHHQFDLSDDVYVETLAELFQVSKQAMTIRIVNLGLLPS